jgi:hypothetical protein
MDIDMNLQEKKYLLARAAVLAHAINLDRFEGLLPYAETTVRLCEILDILCDQIDSEYWAREMNDITCEFEV